MRFRVEDTLTEAQVQSGLNNIIKDGIASQAMGVLTGGAFLIAFAIKLGASNFVIGLLAAIGPLSSVEGIRQMVSFPFSIVRNLAERVIPNENTKTNRKALE